jgi:hypothetical protein
MEILMATLELAPEEINCLRQSLDTITISGKDAKFIATLQTKLELEINSIIELQNQAQIQKQKDLEAAIRGEAIRKAKEVKLPQ